MGFQCWRMIPFYLFVPLHGNRRVFSRSAADLSVMQGARREVEVYFNASENAQISHVAVF